MTSIIKELVTVRVLMAFVVGFFLMPAAALAQDSGCYDCYGDYSNGTYDDYSYGTYDDYDYGTYDDYDYGTYDDYDYGTYDDYDYGTYDDYDYGTYDDYDYGTYDDYDYGTYDDYDYGTYDDYDYGTYDDYSYGTYDDYDYGTYDDYDYGTYDDYDYGTYDDYSYGTYDDYDYGTYDDYDYGTYDDYDYYVEDESYSVEAEVYYEEQDTYVDESYYEENEYYYEERLDYCDYHDCDPDPKPAVCDSFTVSDDDVMAGDTVTLTWETTGATSASISPSVSGWMTNDGSRRVRVTEDVTYTLTARNAHGTDTCSVHIHVTEEDPEPPVCEYFRVSDDDVEAGDRVTLTWATDNADRVRISPNLGSVSRNGSQQVRVYDDITYTLTAQNDDGRDTCSVYINVEEEDDDDGDEPRLRCELDISDSRIDEGDTVRLTWETTGARELKLEDDHGNVLLDTDDLDSNDADDFFDGSLRVKPSRDTEYTLTVERGSQERECEVDVRVDEDETEVVVREVRTYQPTSGVYLHQVPYTGVDASTALTWTFYGLVGLWALYAAYYVAIRRKRATAAADSNR